MRIRPVTLIAGGAVLLVVAALWFTNRAVTPKTPTWDDVVQEAKAGGYGLLTTDDLRGLYAKNPPGLLLVDTRQDWEHRAGHITGSVNFPMEPTAWSRWKKRGELETLLGPDKERTVVFY
jgi:hypothetical protein